MYSTIVMFAIFPIRRFSGEDCLRLVLPAPAAKGGGGELSDVTVTVQ